MAYSYLPSDLAKRLRAAGLTVAELEGWQRRGRPASVGSFAPVGVLWHHTGGSADGLNYARWMTFDGRPDLPPPLCQLSIGRDGTVYVCAAGRCNHAGTARASGSVPAGDGNALYIGVECMNTGSEGWSPAQYAAMVTTGVVLARLLDAPVSAQRAHRETSTTGKWDPGMLNMDKFRADIARGLKPKDTRPAVSLELAKKAARTPSWRLVLSRRIVADRRLIVAALKAERCATYRLWQTRLGYKAEDATGIPDRASLTVLGNKHGFRVVS